MVISPWGLPAAGMAGSFSTLSRDSGSAVTRWANARCDFRPAAPNAATEKPPFNALRRVISILVGPSVSNSLLYVSSKPLKSRQVCVPQDHTFMQLRGPHLAKRHKWLERNVPVAVEIGRQASIASGH